MNLSFFNCQGTFGSMTRSTDVDVNDEFTHFGHGFVDKLCFIQRLPTLFNIARQRWTRFERHCSVNTAPSIQEENWWLVRKEIVEFLWNLRKIINSLDNQERQFALPLIMDNLKEFHNNVGQLRKLNWDRNLGFSLHLHFQGNSLYHFLHANLDLRRIMIFILNDVEKGGSAAEGLFSLDKYLQKIIWDLVGASFIRFSNISLQDYEKVNPFSCTCVQKYWELLIGFIDSRSVQKQTDYFWLMLHNAFKEIQCQESEVVKILTPTLGVVNELGFCWWLLFHLAHLYENESTSDSLDGFSLKQSINSSNHFELNSLLKLTISSEIGGYGEIHLRCYLRCCVKLLNMWEPSIEAPSLLWQYFSKRLNESFRLSDDVALPYCHGKSGILLKNMIEEITGRHGEKPISLNSFHLFLKILSNYLNKPYFRQFKEIQLRIASKLQTQLVQTFNSNGLYNCCCLILVLGSSGDLNEAVKIFLDTVAMPIPYGPDGGKTVVIWRTCFALMFFCLEQSVDFVPLERKMVANMNDLQRELNKSDYKQHPGHWSTELLTVYFESLKDLIENDRYLGLSQSFLLDFDLVDVLARTSESIVPIALTCIQAVVSKLRSFVEEAVLCGGKSKYEAIASTLFCVVVPWIKKLVCADNVHSNGLSVIMLSRVALGLTALRHKCSSTRSPASETFKAYVNYFCFSQQINHEFVCQYVVLLCEEPSLMIQAGKDIIDFQSQIVRLWFRLGFQMSPSSSHYLGISRSILNLSEIEVLFNDVGMPMSDAHSPKEIITQLLRVLAAHHSKNLNVIQIRSKVAVYLVDAAKIIQTILTSNKQDQVMRIYNTIGEIFQHIAALLYIRSKPDCLMHQFTSLLLLPSAIYGLNTKLSSTVTTALKENLTLFIEGISSLDFINDSYIGRTLRDIFSQYLTRFPMNSSPHEMSMHPLYVSFLNVRLKSPRSTEFLIHVMEALRDHYLVRKETHPQLDMCLLFMKEVITRCSTKDRCLVCPSLLQSLLKLMLTSNVKQTVVDLIRLLVDALPRLEDNSIELLHDSVKQIIYEYFKNYQTIPNQIFQLLQSISALYPHTIQRLNLVLGEIISEREKEICGSDENLRRRYREFLSNHERFSTNSNFQKRP